jgi:5-methylcytosine-specific restriction enzyme subunit McrC
MVDMNQVFEDVVGHGLREVLPPDLAVDLQRGDYLDSDRQIVIRPDIVIRNGTDVIAVADAKYKRVGKKGVSTNDVFQALGYATRYGLTECTLIYPERPPVDRVEVRDITIRLAAVEIDRPRSERTTSIAALADRLRRSSLPRTDGSSAFGAVG